MEPTLAELVSGKITPEEACKRMESGLEAIRNDPEQYKPPAMGVPEI